MPAGSAPELNALAFPNGAAVLPRAVQPFVESHNSTSSPATPEASIR